MSDHAPVRKRGRPRRRSRRKPKPRTDRRERLPSRHEVFERLEEAIATSPADETELVWIDSRRARRALRADVGEAQQQPVRRQSVLQARVLAFGRRGSYRSGDLGRGGLLDAVRRAMAHAAVSGPGRASPFLQPNGAGSDPPARVQTRDRRIADLSPEQAEVLLAEHARDDEAAIVDWCDGQVAVRNSHGLGCFQRATSMSLQVRSGLGAGAGFATHAARSLDRLDPAVVFERARRRRTSGAAGEFEDRGVPLLLSPEATAELVEVLNHRAFSASSFRDGSSFLRDHLGVQVFDRSLHLRDDGTDPDGLAFPFDLEGRNKRAVDLVRSGVPKTPTVDTQSAADFGVEPTAHSVGGDEAYALNLFLEPGEHRDQELLRIADGGLWISRLERVECYDPGRVRLRALGRGVRQIEGGRLSRPMPAVLWEDSLLRIFSNLLGIGRDGRSRLSSDGLLGGISVPPVVVGEAAELRPATRF